MIDYDSFEKLINQLESDIENIDKAVKKFNDDNPFTVDGKSVPANWLFSIIEHEYAVIILSLKPNISSEVLKEFTEYSLYNTDGKIGGTIEVHNQVYHLNNKFELYCYISNILWGKKWTLYIFL